MEFKDLIPEGIETIDINLKFRDLEIAIPACRQNEEYVLWHKILSMCFSLVTDMFPDVEMQVEAVDTNILHCVASAQIKADGRVYSKKFGEAKVTLESDDLEKKMPFMMALNRAEDKAYLELFGLASKVFDKDGNPVIYQEDRSVNDEQLPEDLMSGISEEEEQEFNALAKTEIKLNVNGEIKAYTIESLGQNTLKYIAAYEDSKVYSGVQNMVRRYL